MASWNSVSIILFNTNKHQCNLSMVSDASGKWGCGAFSSDGWFQLKWPAEMQDSHITVKELAPIIGSRNMGQAMERKKNIMPYCDNEAVVAILNKDDSREECMVYCLLSGQIQLYFVCTAYQGFPLNDLANTLSCDRLHYFMANYPQAHTQPTTLPPELLDLTIIRKPDWMSSTWTELWKATHPFA